MVGTAVHQLTTLLASTGSLQRSFVAEGPQGPSHAVAVVLGDMTQIAADAYVVPHFQGAASYGGVGAAVARSGAGEGLMAYEREIEKLGRQQEWGEATVTPSGGGRSKALINVVSVGSRDTDQELEVVAASVGAALLVSHQKDLDTIVFPALGTGVIGRLNPGQSARAMIGALFTYWTREPRKAPHQVIIAIYGDPDAYRSFETVLKSGAFTPEAAAVDAGNKKKFDPGKWCAVLSGGMAVEDELKGNKGPREKP